MDHLHELNQVIFPEKQERPLKMHEVCNFYIQSCFSDVPASGMYFMTYELVQKILTKNSETGKIGVLSTIFAGGSAGIANWLVAMPADVLKSRLQTGMCLHVI